MQSEEMDEHFDIVLAWMSSSALHNSTSSLRVIRTLDLVLSTFLRLTMRVFSRKSTNFFSSMCDVLHKLSHILMLIYGDILPEKIAQTHCKEQNLKAKEMDGHWAWRLIMMNGVLTSFVFLTCHIRIWCELAPWDSRTAFCFSRRAFAMEKRRLDFNNTHTTVETHSRDEGQLKVLVNSVESCVWTVCLLWRWEREKIEMSPGTHLSKIFLLLNATLILLSVRCVTKEVHGSINDRSLCHSLCRTEAYINTSHWYLSNPSPLTWPMHTVLTFHLLFAFSIPSNTLEHSG